MNHSDALEGGCTALLVSQCKFFDNSFSTKSESMSLDKAAGADTITYCVLNPENVGEMSLLCSMLLLTGFLDCLPPQLPHDLTDDR